jgi:hypothetical protein
MRKQLKGTPKRQPKRVYIIVKWRSIEDGCSKLSYRRKQPKLQLLQNPREINGDNLINVRQERTDASGIKVEYT